MHSLALSGKSNADKSLKLSVQTDRNILEHKCIIVVWIFLCSLSISIDGEKCNISVPVECMIFQGRGESKKIFVCNLYYCATVVALLQACIL